MTMRAHTIYMIVHLLPWPATGLISKSSSCNAAVEIKPFFFEGVLCSGVDDAADDGVVSSADADAAAAAGALVGVVVGSGWRGLGLIRCCRAL